MKPIDSNIKTLFFTNGNGYRVILQIDGESIIMFQTSDDRNIDAVWLAADSGSQSAIYLMLAPVENPGWRRMEETGIDSSLIRNIIAALNYHIETDLKDDTKHHAETIVEASRYI